METQAQNLIPEDKPAHIPPEVRAQGEAAVDAYVSAMQASEVERNAYPPIRIMLVGDGHAGKTSLLRRLIQEQTLPLDEAMTPRLEILEWQVPDTCITAHIWDFGGQIIAHAAHQIFFRPSCLYILILAARAEISDMTQAQYWLEQIKVFAAQAPVLIVGNKADLSPLHLDLQSLHEQYPNIAGFFQVSCLRGTGFTELQQALQQELQRLAQTQVRFLPQHLRVVHEIRTLATSSVFISQDQFADMCAKHHVPEDGGLDRDWLLDVLDKLGIVIHFPQLPFWNAYLLNPRWVTYGIYTLMYAGKYRLDEREALRIFSRESVCDESGQVLHYEPPKIRLLFDLMHAYRLCYPLADQAGGFILPALLPSTEPNHQFSLEGALVLEWVFPILLPRHVIAEFTVARYREIWQGFVWARGVCLQHQNWDAQALIKVDYALRSISMAINGKDAREYLPVLRDEMHAILNRISISFQEQLCLPPAALLRGPQVSAKVVEKVPLQQVLAFAANGMSEYISLSGRVWDLAKILGSYGPFAAREVASHLYNRNIINSRSAEIMQAQEAGKDQPGQVHQAVRRNLPLGIETFAEIITGNFYYVDKTHLILQMVKQGKYYFLSRPRRFGKSLLIDTIKELFECNQPLFKNLAVYKNWNWDAPCPVIRISFNDGGLENRKDLEQRILHLLKRNSESLAIPFAPTADPVEGFGDLIRATAKAYSQPVVILVDEYDKPILDQIHAPEIAREMRECLRGFYSAIKGADASIAFALITGVSKFSKVSLFSGLNNLRDITVSSDYSALCGYTDADIDHVFGAELMELNREEIRRWYNGYNWLGTPVYNPHGVLSLFQERKFRPFWFESATPTFLIKILKENDAWLPGLGSLLADADMLSTFDVDTIPVPALMFQTGYLTIDKEVEVGGTYYYQMRFPNREVEQSLYGSLLRDWTANQGGEVKNKVHLYQCLTRNKINELQALFQSFYSSIPHQWFDNNPISKYEGYYASVFYAYFVAAGLNVRAEDATNQGRIDMSVHTSQNIYIFEFKVVTDETTGTALQQIKDKRYFDKYSAQGLPITLVGVEFSKVTRNIIGFEYDVLS